MFELEYWCQLISPELWFRIERIAQLDPALGDLIAAEMRRRFPRPDERREVVWESDGHEWD